MEFLLDLLLLAVVFWLGKKYQTWMFIADIYKDPDHYLELAKKVKEAKVEIEASIAEEQQYDNVEVRSEVVNDTVYIYNSQTGEFLAQAENHFRALMLASERYPNKRFRHNPKL